MPKSAEKKANLIAAINDSTRHLNTFTASFFVTCAYLFLAVTLVSHQTLLLESDVDLPPLSFKVPLVPFAILVPLVVILLHLLLLLQESFLLRRLRRLGDGATASVVAEQLFPGLAVSIFIDQTLSSSVQLLLRLIRLSVYVALPLALLCWLQIRFLPYHRRPITFWHQAIVVSDLLLISYYLRTLLLLREKPPKRNDKRIWILRIVTLLPIAAFSLLYAIVPGSWPELEYLCGRPMPFGLQKNLSLRERALVREPPHPELLAARLTKGTLDTAYLELAHGVDLSNRDLRCADFTSSKLFNADLRGADLRGAILVDTDLRGAKVSPDATHHPVRLAEALLWRADLRDLQLSRVNLVGARLEYADLRRADLSRGRLEFAHLSHAKLTGSKLFGVSLVGADLRGAYLEGVDLTDARLDGAVLAEAHLEAAQFRGATALGTIFSNARLQGATSLILNGSILRQSRMKNIDFCQATDPKKGPMLTDLRGVDFNTAANWNEIITRLVEGTHTERKIVVGFNINTEREQVIARLMDNAPNKMNRILERLDAAWARQEEGRIACLAGDKDGRPRGSGDMAHRRLLYNKGLHQLPMADWPPVADQGLSPVGGWSEVEFYEHLATALWGHACEEEEGLLARALAERTLGNHPPSDPLLNMHLAFQYMQLRGRKCPDEERQDDSEKARACPGFAEIGAKTEERIVEIARSSPLCSKP